MDLLHSFGTWGGSITGILLPFLFVLTLVVFFHELGHFYVARLCGVRVDAFSIGFGPELFGWVDKKGTRWKISAIPLGGYVKFFGDADAASRPDHDAGRAMSEEDKKVSFLHKSVAQRAAIVAAGPVANFLLAIAVFALTFMLVGKMIAAPRVDTVSAGSAAERAGFIKGDLILSIDGTPIESFGDLQRIVSSSPDVSLQVEVERDTKKLTLTAKPDVKVFKDKFGGTNRIGLLGLSRTNSHGDIIVRRYDPVTSVGMAVKETWFIVERTFSYLSGVISGRESADQLGGPIRIAQVSGEAAEAGFGALFVLMAVLSVSVGLLNLFPIPMLDGGHLLFYVIEAIKGRPLGEKAQDYAFRVGMALVLMLMIFSTWNDIRGLIGS